MAPIGRSARQEADMEFRLLGPLEAWHCGRPVDLGDRQQRYVLAALLLEANKPVSVDRLTEIVWGPAGHKSAAQLINGYIEVAPLARTARVWSQ
jgi:DNA-binding SARP family transcriptional activator